MKVDKVFAGGFHSFIVLDSEKPKEIDNDFSYAEDPAECLEGIDELPEGVIVSEATSSLNTDSDISHFLARTEIDQMTIVYSEMDFSHFFWKFSVVNEKSTIQKVKQLLRSQLKIWENPTLGDKNWIDEVPLKEFIMQTDTDIVHEAQNKVLSRGTTSQNRQILTVNLVCDVIEFLQISVDDIRDEDLDQEELEDNVA